MATANEFFSTSVDEPLETRTDDRWLPWSTHGDYGGWWGPRRFEEPTTTTDTPIVCVHGKGNTGDDWMTHAQMCSAGDRAYGDFWAITFRTPVSTHDEMAEQLEAFVTRVREFTDADQVIILAHSLGVTAARHWMYTRNRVSWVDTFIGLAGANHGIPSFAYLDLEVFDEPRQTVCQYLNPRNENGIMRLNDDETPGEVSYYTIRGAFDHYFFGDSQSPRLEGAENIVLPVSHNGTRLHGLATQRIRDIL